MPSPFPGMDPYLEHPRLWPNVHHRLISACGDELGARLRPRYYVGIEERAFLTDVTDPGWRAIIPDVHVVEPQSEWSLGMSSGVLEPEDGGVAIDVAEPIVVEMLIDEEIRLPYIEILDSQSRAVITVIEILSPTNKVPHSNGRTLYTQKRAEILGSQTHLVEIDLLRTGAPFLPATWKPSWDYLVHVSRSERRPGGELWQIKLKQRLPVINIPLKAGDDDAKLDLQAIFSSVYDRAGFDLVVNYREPPDPPLEPMKAAWAEAWLKNKGLR